MAHDSKWLTEMVAAEQEKRRKLSRVALKNSCSNGLAGWACAILAFWTWPWHWNTALWIAAVLLWTVAWFQFESFLVNNKASQIGL